MRPDTAYYEQIPQLAPWKLKLVQITRASKVRRLPTEPMMRDAVTHCGAILEYETGHITIETEPVETGMNPGKKFDEAIAYGVLLLERRRPPVLTQLRTSSQRSQDPRRHRSCLQRTPSLTSQNLSLKNIGLIKQEVAMWFFQVCMLEFRSGFNLC